MVIDLSHWNEVTDWHAVARSGVLGVVHKFSEGTSYRDPMYEKARAGAKSAGLLFGRYHFANGNDVKAQVKNFMVGAAPDELLALDWEDTSPRMSLSQAVAFVQEVQQLTGSWPVVYSGNTAKEALGSTPNPVLAKCRLWLAQYSSKPVTPPGWAIPWLWQWTDAGTIAGIVGGVDLDAYGATADRLADEWADGRAQPEIEPEPPDPGRDPSDVVTLTVTIPAGSRVVVRTTGDNDNIVMNDSC